jgi:sirohydrochlorin cobaltochelatase
VRLAPEDLAALETLTARLKIILPETYHDCMEDIRPNPMGGAGLKYDADGRVAWDRIWNSFCDLAMAGGPPHKGKLLQPEPATPAGDANFAEIIRGIGVVTGLQAIASPHPGWIRVTCHDETMAAWLARAITMENVAVHHEGSTLDLPTSPTFRVEKEVKSVIVTVAKTFHYWSSHMSAGQHRRIAELFAEANQHHPLLQPARKPHAAAVIEAPKELPPAQENYPGWQGFACPNLWSAVWMMRALSVSNVLARRESNVLFLPTNPQLDPTCAIATQALHQVHHLAAIHGIL